MIPGVSVSLVASITDAPGGTGTEGPTAAIFPAWTHTEVSASVPWLAVITVAWVITQSCEAASVP
jgi:hypothetical protein